MLDSTPAMPSPEFDVDYYVTLRGHERYSYLEPFVNEALSNGGTVAACARLYRFDVSHYWHWLRKDKVRYEEYEDSLRRGAEPAADEFRELIGKLSVTNDPVKIRRMQVQADLLWKYISRISPRMYSEKAKVDRVGGENPLDMLTDDQRVRIAQAFLKSKGILGYGAED